MEEINLFTLDIKYIHKTLSTCKLHDKREKHEILWEKKLTNNIIYIFFFKILMI